MVVPNFNGSRWLKECLESVEATQYPSNRLEIVVVDNGSTDDGLQQVDSLIHDGGPFPIRIIRNHSNLGWSPANNQGFESSKADVLISLSNDVRVDPLWVQELVEAFTSDSLVGVLQCHVRSLYNHEVLDAGLSFVDRFGFSYGYQPNTAPSPSRVFYAEGAAFALSRRAFERLSGLDGDYFMQYDDIDFSWRAQLLGFKVKFVPRALVYHARGGTVGSNMFETWPLILFLVTRNHLTTLYKTLGTRRLAYVLPTVTVFHIAKALLLVSYGEPRRGLAVIRGVVAFVSSLKHNRLKRMKIQRERTLSDREVFLIEHGFRPDLLLGYLRAQKSDTRPFLPITELSSNIDGRH